MLQDAIAAASFNVRKTSPVATAADNTEASGRDLETSSATRAETSAGNFSEMVFSIDCAIVLARLAVAVDLEVPLSTEAPSCGS
jgi:hypothetical protein